MSTNNLFTVKLANAKCLRRQDESAESEERRAQLLKQYTTGAITRLVADDRFDAEKDIEVWTGKDDDGESKVAWFLRWAQSKKAIKEKSMEQMSANQVCSINFWDKIKPLDIGTSKRKVAQKVPPTVQWVAEDGSGAMVEVPVATAAQGKSVQHPADVKPRAQPSPAVKASSSLSLITDAASAEVEKSNGVLNGMSKRAVGKKTVDLYTPTRSNLKSTTGVEPMTLAQLAAQISIDKASNTDNDALAILKPPAGREQKWGEWVEEITQQNTSSDPKKVPWRAIIPIAVEAGSLVAKEMAKVGAEQIQRAHTSELRLEKSLAQSQDMHAIVAGENTCLKERNAALDAKIVELEEEIVNLRAQLAEAKAAAAPPAPSSSSKEDKKTKAKEEKKKKHKEEKKEKKRLASQADTPSLPASKKAASPKKQPESYASAAYVEEADEV